MKIDNTFLIDVAFYKPLCPEIIRQNTPLYLFK